MLARFCTNAWPAIRTADVLPVVLDGTEAWLLASSAVLFLVCGAGLLANARSRLRREHDG